MLNILDEWLVLFLWLNVHGTFFREISQPGQNNFGRPKVVNFNNLAITTNFISTSNYNLSRRREITVVIFFLENFFKKMMYQLQKRDWCPTSPIL